ncbi:hypothetical protein ACFLVU_02405 [Chloroflexota bacterium]
MEVEHPELNTTMTYPGAFGISSEVSPGISCRAPLIGEHNEYVFKGILGLSGEEYSRLVNEGVIS